jgi:hypothetical protein
VAAEDGSGMGDSVFINGRAAVHKGSSGTCTATPDVCLCPPAPPAGPVPTPLVNMVVAADMDGGASTVQVEGNPVGTRQSFFSKSTGDEVAQTTGGGVLTAVVQGQAKFGFGYSRNVMIEGQAAVRHLDPLTHNHAGPTGNTPPAPWLSTMDPEVPRMPPMSSVKDLGKKGGWVELEVTDDAGKPLTFAQVEVTLPDGTRTRARILGSGTLAMRGIPEGSCSMECTSLGDDQRKRSRRESKPQRA